MVSFEGLQFHGNSPIYQQIIDHLKAGIMAARVTDGDEMPSRRVLSTLLGVNPNTVQKAYRMLEEEGLILSKSGAKSYVILTNEAVLQVQHAFFRDKMFALVQEMYNIALPKDEVQKLLDSMWRDLEKQPPTWSQTEENP